MLSLVKTWEEKRCFCSICSRFYYQSLSMSLLFQNTRIWPLQRLSHHYFSISLGNLILVYIYIYYFVVCLFLVSEVIYTVLTLGVHISNPIRYCVWFWFRNSSWKGKNPTVDSHFGPIFCSSASLFLILEVWVLDDFWKMGFAEVGFWLKWFKVCFLFYFLNLHFQIRAYLDEQCGQICNFFLLGFFKIIKKIILTLCASNG